MSVIPLQSEVNDISAACACTLPPPRSTEIPVLWVRLDPEFQWLRLLTVEQADSVWQCLLKYERDANAQLEVGRSEAYIAASPHSNVPASTSNHRGGVV